MMLNMVFLLGKLSSSTIFADKVETDTNGLRFFSNSCTIYRELATALRHAM